MAPSLPSETLDQIVDFLHADRAALIACSRASSVLVPASRHHLFQEVELESTSMCNFLKLLDVPWSTVAPAVRRIVVRDRRTLRAQRRRRNGFYIPEDPARLRRRLQGITSVRFTNISLADIPPPFWRLLHDLKGITHMEAHQMSFDSPTEFFEYICTLPALESLSISQSWWEKQAASEMGQLRPIVPFCIPLLDVGKHSQQAALEWFLEQKPIPPVHTFRINLDSGSASVDLIRQYIESAGPAMQHLDIFVPGGTPDIERLAQIDFSHCNSVRSVQIEGLQITQQQGHATAVEKFMRVLFSQLKSPSLNDVSVSVTIDANDATASFFGIPDNILLHSYNWGGLPEIIDTSLGTKLEKLTVAIRGYETYQHNETEAFLRKGPFKSFQGREILNIEFPAPPTSLNP